MRCRSNNATFLQLAQATLESSRRARRATWTKRQTAIGELVKPVKESLQKFDVKIGEIEKLRAEAYSG